MFSLLEASSRGTGGLKVAWEPSVTIKSKCAYPEAIQPSMLDVLAAPTVFMQQTLVYPDVLDCAALIAASQYVVDAYPVFCARLTQQVRAASSLQTAMKSALLQCSRNCSQGPSRSQDDQLRLFHSTASSAGISFLQGRIPNLTLQQLLQQTTTSKSQEGKAPSAAASQHVSPFVPRVTGQQHQEQKEAGNQVLHVQQPLNGQQEQQQEDKQWQQRQLNLPELPDALFGHLPGALTPHYVDCPELPLVHVALVQLSGGGSVLGVRLSHLLGDWGSARLLLRSITSAYTQIMQQQHQRSSSRSTSGAAADMPLAAEHAVLQDPDSTTLSGLVKKMSSLNAVGVTLPDMVPAGPLLNRLVLTAQQQLLQDFQPSRLRLLEPADALVFARLAELSNSSSSSSGGGHGSGHDGGNDVSSGNHISSGNGSGCSVDDAGRGRASDSNHGREGNIGDGNSGQPKRLTYQVSSARIQQLKQEAAAMGHLSSSSSRTDGEGTSFQQGPGRIFTTHNVLLAAVVKVFCGLPGRAGVPHDIGIAADMRGRVPSQYCQHQEQQQRHLAAAVGNFFCSAILEDCVPEGVTNGKLVQQLHDALHR
jgi:hypothetical protein